MNKKKLFATLKKSSPKILVILGAVGLATTVISAIKQTPKVNFAIDEATTKKGEDLTKVEKAKIYVKGYAPTMAFGTVTLACFVGGEFINARAISMLDAAYVSTSKAFKEYTKKVDEIMPPKKKEELDKAIAKDAIAKNLVAPSEIVYTGKGNDHFKDLWSGREFYSNMAAIQATFNRANKCIMEEGSISLNEFYMTLGIPTNGCGEYYGWNSDCCSILRPIFTVDDDTGIICMNFNESPVFNLYYL